MARDTVGAEISGIEDLMAAFDAVGAVGAKSAMQAAARKAMKPVAAQARQLAPRSNDGEGIPLADSIVIRTTLPKNQKRKRGGRLHPAEVFVVATAPHAHLVEYGHRLVKARHEGTTRHVRRGDFRILTAVKTKRVIGHVAPKPFMRPAFDANRKAALDIFAREIGTMVERVAKRYARQAQRGKLSRGARKAFEVEV